MGLTNDNTMAVRNKNRNNKYKIVHKMFQIPEKKDEQRVYVFNVVKHRISPEFVYGLFFDIHGVCSFIVSKILVVNGNEFGMCIESVSKQ